MFLQRILSNSLRRIPRSLISSKSCHLSKTPGSSLICLSQAPRVQPISTSHVKWNDNDDSEEEVFHDMVKEIEIKPFNALTPDMKEQLINGIDARMFKLKMLKEEMKFFVRKEYPLPEEFTLKQWQTLMDLKDRESRTRYIDAIVEGNEEEQLPKIRELDQLATSRMEFKLNDFLHLDLKMSKSELKEKLGIIQDVYDCMQEEGEDLPLHLSDEMKAELMENMTPMLYRKLFSFWGRKRRLQVLELVNNRIRHTKGAKIREQILEERQNANHIVYGLGHNCIFFRINNRQTDAFEHWNSIREFNSWGQPLVIDLSFMNVMNFKRAKSLLYRELLHGINRNKKSRLPYALYLTSFNPECEKCRLLEKMVPNIHDPSYPVMVTEKSYMDLFPRENLLYLTPDSKVDLIDYSPDDIYIIGGLVDGHSNVARTLAEAKSNGIRHARLPLKKYIGMSSELNIDHVLATMIDFRETRDWFYSFRWVPPRFFRNRVVSFGYDVRDEAVYTAHATLCPQNGIEYENIGPEKYRSMYSEIVTKKISEARQEGAMARFTSSRFKGIPNYEGNTSRSARIPAYFKKKALKGQEREKQIQPKLSLDELLS